MNEINDILKALKQTFHFFRKGKLLVYFIPGIILTLFSFLVLNSTQYLFNSFNFIEKTPWIGHYLIQAKNSAFGWMIGIGGFIYQFTILTIFSPINTILSEDVETLLTNKTFPFKIEKFIRDFIRLLGIVSIGFILYAFAYVIWLILAKIIGLGSFTPLISFLLTSFFTGFNSYDYSLERHNVSIRNSWIYAFKNPWRMTTTGAIYSGLIFLPAVGMILAPILSTIVATIIYLNNNK